MLNNFTAIPISIGLTVVAMSTTTAVKENKIEQLFGSDKFALCDLSGQNCTAIKTVEQIPIKLAPPLGLATASNDKEVACLAKNICEESLHNYTDMVHVGWGTINGVLSQHNDFKKFKTICDYVYSGRMAWIYNPKKKTGDHMDCEYAKNKTRSGKYLKIAKNLLLGQTPNPTPWCNFTNWDNIKLDREGTSNKRVARLPSSCSVKPEGSYHVYIGYK